MPIENPTLIEKLEALIANHSFEKILTDLHDICCDQSEYLKDRENIKRGEDFEGFIKKLAEAYNYARQKEL